MFETILALGNGKITEINPKKLGSIAKGKGAVLIELKNPSKEELTLLSETFPLHEIALDYCLADISRGKLDEFPQHLFLVMHEVEFQNRAIKVHEIDFFLGANFLIVSHKGDSMLVSTVKQRLVKEPELFKKGADYLLYLVMNELVESHFPVLESIDDEVDMIEDEVFGNPDKDVLNRTFKLKRQVLILRKTINPQRDVIAQLSGEGFNYVKSQQLLYFRDLYNHSIRIFDLIDTYRDLITGILDAYLSVVSNRLNQIMKVLTIIATIMMPLTLITGIYGMNFQFMPEIHSAWGLRYGYFFALGIMLIVALAMVAYFKKNDWL